MGRELQKKKNRSSIPKVKHKQKSKRVNPLGNAIIAANWDSKQTLTQNYARLGLASRLNAATGGTETKTKTSSTVAKLAITAAVPSVVAPSVARVERDESGKIVRVIHGKTARANPLNDPLNALSDEEEEVVEEKSEVVRMLEEQAGRVAERKPRTQSTREKEWCERLVERWGSDYRAMARDGRLNPMQQTEADVRRRVERWRAGRE